MRRISFVIEAAVRVLLTLFGAVVIDLLICALIKLL